MPDLSDAVNWSELDANNNQAPPNGWPEGMMPSDVNDAARADRGALKRFWDKINPVTPITPSGGIYTFTTNNPAYPTAYINGEIYCFYPGSPSIGGDQFQVNALGPKPILKHTASGAAGFVPIAAYDILDQRAAQLDYNSTLNGGTGAFLLLNPFIPITGDGTGTGISVHGQTYTNTLSSAGIIVVTAGGINVTGNSSITGTLGVTGFVTAGDFESNGNVSVPNGWLQCTHLSTTAGDAQGYGVTINNANLWCNGTAYISSIVASGSGGIIVQAGGLNIQSGGLIINGLTQAQNINANNITVYGNGYKPGGGPWADSSDVRLKEDVYPYTAGLAAVTALRPVTYQFNGRGGTPRDGRRFVGLVADEVEGVMPEMVGRISQLLDPDDKDPTEIKTLDATALTFALVNCCKELAARVAALEAQIAVQG